MNLPDSYTTGKIAEMLSDWAGAPGAFTSHFVLGQVNQGLLIARVNYRGGNRKRARVRIHRDDLLAYVHQHHDHMETVARSHFSVAA